MSTPATHKQAKGATKHRAPAKGEKIIVEVEPDKSSKRPRRLRPVNLQAEGIRNQRKTMVKHDLAKVIYDNASGVGSSTTSNKTVEHMLSGLTPAGREAARFAISPGEGTQVNSYPSGGVTATCTAMARITNQSVAAPANLAEGKTWDCVIVTIPSLDIAAWVLTFPTSSEPLLDISQFLGGMVGGSSSTGQVLIYPDSEFVPLIPSMGTTAQTLPLYQMSVSPFVFKDPDPVFDFDTDEFVFMDFSNQKSGNRPVITRRKAADPTALIPQKGCDWIKMENYNYPVAAQTTVFNSNDAFRILGQSVTAELVCTDLTNSGLVFTKPILRSVTAEPNSYFNAQATATGYDQAPEVHIAQTMGDLWHLPDVPLTPDRLGANGYTFKGQAKDGAYSISRLVGPNQMVPTNMECYPIALSTGSPSYIGIPFHADLSIPKPNGGESAVKGIAPIMTVCHPDWTPTVTIFTGLNPEATLSLKIYTGFEYAPSASSTSAKYAKVPPALDSRASNVIQRIHRSMLPGYPASANSESSILQEVLNLVPVVGPLLGLI